MSVFVRKHLDLLGRHVVDRVTSLAGIVTSVSFDLTGCSQALVSPGLKDGGELATQVWLDANRLIVGPGEPVMAPPNYLAMKAAAAGDGTGPVDKPIPGA